MDQMEATDNTTTAAKTCLKRSHVEADTRAKRQRDLEGNGIDTALEHYYEHRMPHTEDEWNHWERISAKDRTMNDISNLLLNFSLERIEAPEWPDVPPLKAPPLAATPPQPYDKFPPKVGEVVFGYHLDEVVAVGKRTALFVCHKDGADTRMIAKVAIEGGFEALMREMEAYKKLSGCGAALMRDYIRWNDWKSDTFCIRWGLVVLERLGPNLLDAMKRFPSGVIEPMDRVYGLAVQMIDCVERMHSKGWIHCSLKPENLLMDGEPAAGLKAIGLRYSKQYVALRTNGTLAHIPEPVYDHKKLPVGDPNFHSIGYHNRFCRSRRDDMESLGYCIVFMAKGSLPWMSRKHRNLMSTKTIREIGTAMKETSLEELCAGLSPRFVQYFQIISHYEFEDEPNYSGLRQCFRV
ncbi:unnamed protein product [Oppiella nova]|uniref:Protein kinase domain-containing protein n=1 Tax=Oppiella nova TaxID=334625 RepID=A0A7R9QV84_9ACAR|nr:unnamed protein product [Oppiella nova]CAG2176291.1 unnamed protein product [Oppiella nova]